MRMKMLAFRTVGFRSIVDSGWVTLDDVTALVGINESGKSNLLQSLWKFRPAGGEGAIVPLDDYPRDRYHQIRAMDDDAKPIFVTVRFAIDDTLAAQIADKTGLPAEGFDVVEIWRRYNGKRWWSFPNCKVVRTVGKTQLLTLLEHGREELAPLDAFQNEGDLKERMLQSIEKAISELPDGESDANQVSSLVTTLTIDQETVAKTSKIGPVFEDIIRRLNAEIANLQRPDATRVEGLWKFVFAHVPKFVFYSNYGNLDSEIYLPHVIDNLERTDLGPREAAKARTLKVLFEFVKLSPEEILDLGAQETPTAETTEETIEQESEKTRERRILLQSASVQLTRQFKDWWKQGDYTFEFDADGNHFRIWVSDDKRPEKIELPGRSTGLQWFFSFYLTFLVEAGDAHSNSVLLLDEAGLSLHPLAQRDLFEFFENLSETNQIIYTTHSPFLVEPDGLDKVRSVYIDDDGRTTVSPDLRANPKIPSAAKSIYAVHVALGLSVSDTFLVGCLPILVEGMSDQRYLTAIKNYLIGKGRINPSKDIVFLPAGGTGTKGVAAVISIVGAKEENLPPVLIDSDGPGNSLKQKLLSGTYQGAEDNVHQVGDYSLFEGAEVEDLIPMDQLANVVTRYLPRPAGSDEDFDDVAIPGKPIIPQIEAYAARHDLELTPGWKVEVSTLFKGRLDRMDIPDEYLDRWENVFNDLLGVTKSD